VEILDTAGLVCQCVERVVELVVVVDDDDDDDDEARTCV
jgi:hypothetical protein